MVKIRTAPGKIAKLTGTVLIFCLFNIFYSGSAFAANYPPTVGTITPSSGSSNINDAVSFTTTYSDRNGWKDIKYAYLLINTSTAGSKCFYVYYDRQSNKLYLRNDKNTAWLGGFAPGSSNMIENSYAKLNCSKTSASGSGTTLTITWNVAFKSTFVGAKNMYLKVVDKADGSSGNLTKKGAWKITNIVLSISINPKLWDIGSAKVNSIVTMPKANKIVVTNNGNITETFTLALMNPPGWTAANVPARDTYAISGLFCAATAVPTENNFNKDSTLYEDVISTTPKKATKTIFGYNNSVTNGASVPKGQGRALYLQFQSPTLTDEQEEKNISIIVSCQTP